MDAAKRMADGDSEQGERVEVEQKKFQTTMDLETRHVVMSIIGRGGSKIRQLGKQDWS